MMDTQWSFRIRRLNRRRWLVWTPLAFAFLASYFHRTATGMVADSLMHEFSIARASDFGALASVYFYIYALMQLPAGILADYYGPRRTVSLALGVATLGAIVFATARNIPGLYIGRILSSLGVSLIYVNIAKIHSQWFRTREFTTMTGILVASGSVGFLLAATPLALLVEQVGWRISFLVIAAYSLLAAITCWCLVKDRPADLGLPAVADVEAVEGRVAAGFPATDHRYAVMASLKMVMGNPYTWWPFLASVTLYGVYMAFMGLWSMPYLMQIYGMSRVTASGYISVMAVGTMVGGPIIGWISDRLGLRRLPNVVTSIGFLFIWLILTVWNGGKPPQWALYPISLGIGLGMSGVNLNVACGKEVNPPQMTGMVAGIVNSGSFVGSALMQPLFGWVLDRNWQGMTDHGVRVYPLGAYQSAFWVCGVVLGLGVITTLLIRENCAASPRQKTGTPVRPK